MTVLETSDTVRHLLTYPGVFPDYRSPDGLYYWIMTVRRALITRFIAALIAITLSTQIAGAQVLKCIHRSAPHESSGHSAMVHQANPNGIKADDGAPHTDIPAAALCGQTMMCANAAAMPLVGFRVTEIGQATLPISFVRSNFEARSPRPDSPPPKI